MHQVGTRVQNKQSITPTASPKGRSQPASNFLFSKDFSV